MKYDKFTLKLKGDNLVGLLYTPTKSCKKAIIFLAGSGGTKERFFMLCEHFAKKGYASISFDFRGRGESLTKKIPMLRSQTVDAKKLIDYLNLKISTLNEIILVATSMGAHVAASVCNYDKKIKKLMLIAPAIYNKNMESWPFINISVGKVNKKDIANATSLVEIRKFIGELYIVQLNKDSTIFTWMINVYLNNARKAKVKKKLNLRFRHAIFRYDEGKEKVTHLLDRILN